MIGRGERATPGISAGMTSGATYADRSAAGSEVVVIASDGSVSEAGSSEVRTGSEGSGAGSGGDRPLDSHGPYRAVGLGQIDRARSEDQTVGGRRGSAVRRDRIHRQTLMRGQIAPRDRQARCARALPVRG